MPRLLGVEIPGDKRIEASLPYIYGIGPSTAKKILEQANVEPSVRAKDLTPEQLNHIIQAITASKLSIEGDLRREIQANLKRLQAINCYRGIRHRRVFRYAVNGREPTRGLVKALGRRSACSALKTPRSNQIFEKAYA